MAGTRHSGKWFDGGVELSGGEWQKIALGRAFMRDARILVLDEPTSALDAQAEFELFARLRRLAAGRTAIYISHRFSTVRQADRILFLEHGALVEQGTHDELMALGGRYARLFTLQAAAYTGASVDGLTDLGGVGPRTTSRSRGRRWGGPGTAGLAGRRGAGDCSRPGLAPVKPVDSSSPGRRPVRPRRRSIAIATVAGTALALGGGIARRSAGERLSARTERRLTGRRSRPYVLTAAVADLHERLTIVDLHADSLIWGRDLLRRADRGHVDVPRLAEGNVAVQVFAVATKVPRHLNIEGERRPLRRRDARRTRPGLAGGELGGASSPVPSTRPARLRSILAAASGGQLTLIRTAAGPRPDPSTAAASARPSLAGLLAIEGAHALDDDAGERRPASTRQAYRMVGLTHFFDNAFGGSAHGARRVDGRPCRELVVGAGARRMIVDLAHASAATIDDVLAVATRPVVASHTGVRAVCDTPRNVPTTSSAGSPPRAGWSGSGSGRPPAAAGAESSGSRDRSPTPSPSSAPTTSRLGSDFDGARSRPVRPPPGWAS